MKKRVSVKKVSKKDYKSFYFGIGIVVFILVFAIVWYSLPKDSDSSIELAKCIGEKSTLYVQYGCPHCRTQEELFGEDVNYLNIVDCYYERDKCPNIQATPTWVIDGKQYLGVQSLDKLKELTGC